MKRITTIDLWVGVGEDDQRAVLGAFMDSMHNPMDYAYNRYALTVTPVKSDGFFIDKSWGLDYNLSRFNQNPARSSRHSRLDQSAIFNNLRILPFHKRPHNGLAREVCERVLYI